MNDNDFLAARFEEHRTHIRSVALRMLGSSAAADDAVQDTWLRLVGADALGVANLRGWLTTVVSRICLDVIRSRSTRREDLTETPLDTAGVPKQNVDPADEAELADTVGAALVVVLDRLAPSERLAFVLQDVFGVPFDEIGMILDRSPAAAKQLASRARNKVRGSQPGNVIDVARQRGVVEAFLRAARDGDLAGLIMVLHPDIVLEADSAAVRMGSPVTTRGADSVAAMFSGRALGAEIAVVDDNPGLAWIVNGTVKVAWNFFIDNDHIVHIDMHADQTLLNTLAIKPSA